ncbi:MAG: hypothetical protein WKF57_17340 [Nakamurella sp.]
MSAPWIGFKRWRLRAGITETALIALVRNEIVPHYRTLDPQVTLGLVRSDIPRQYVATQQWPSGGYRKQVCSGDRYTRWFDEYLPILARFDVLAEFAGEIDRGD